MCRSIITLRNLDHPVTEEEIEAAARQFVRKISGFRHPSRRNEAVFEHAIVEITSASRALLDGLVVRGAAAK
jgi:hypothetical protein